MLGKYRAYKRHWEVDTTYPRFIEKLQSWLAIFAFLSFIVFTIMQAIWGWWSMLKELTNIQWIAYIIGSLGALVFLGFCLWSLSKFLKLCWRAVWGETIQVSDDMPANMLEAITPIAEKESLKEYKAFVSKLIQHRNKLDKTILEYQGIIHKLEAKNERTSDKPK